MVVFPNITRIPPASINRWRRDRDDQTWPRTQEWRTQFGKRLRRPTKFSQHSTVRTPREHALHAKVWVSSTRICNTWIPSRFAVKTVGDVVSPTRFLR